jgi:hypothetical protein
LNQESLTTVACGLSRDLHAEEKNIHNFASLSMNVRNRLRNSLVRKLQQLPTEKLTEVNNFLSKIESQLKSKDKTLKLAGTWKDLDDNLFTEMTEKLHGNRTKDRQIDLQ